MRCGDLADVGQVRVDTVLNQRRDSNVALSGYLTESLKQIRPELDEKRCLAHVSFLLVWELDAVYTMRL